MCTSRERTPADGDNIIYSNNVKGDIFVWRLNLSGQGGQNSYFEVFGREQADFGTAIALDSNHIPWIAAATYTSSATSSGNILIFNLFPDGFRREIDFASDGEDVPLAIAIDPSDRPWITGKTCGNGFPTTDGILHRTNHCAVFVLRFENSGVERMGMVFGGADGDDLGVGIAMSGDFDAYVTGYANSSSFPTTEGAFQTTKANAGAQAFVTQVDSTAFQGRIIHSTFLSSDGSTISYAIANNDARVVFVAGSTSSSHLPGGPVLTPNPTAASSRSFHPIYPRFDIRSFWGLL